MKKLGISIDCLCDLPAGELAALDVGVMQYYIHTATGRFLSGSEITFENIMEYFESGSVFLRASALGPEECRAYFQAMLEEWEEIVHITVSSRIGLSYANAQAALRLMGKDAQRVTLVDSGSLSAGMGHMLRLAVSLREQGRSAGEIAKACGKLRGKVSVSFLMANADGLYRSGYVGRTFADCCRLLRLCPVFCIREGRLTLKTFYVGKFERAVLRYVRKALGSRVTTHKDEVFITHAGCPAALLNRIRERAAGRFKAVSVSEASAFIAASFGPGALGVMVKTR